MLARNYRQKDVKPGIVIQYYGVVGGCRSCFSTTVYKMPSVIVARTCGHIEHATCFHHSPMDLHRRGRIYPELSWGQLACKLLQQPRWIAWAIFMGIDSLVLLALSIYVIVRYCQKRISRMAVEATTKADTIDLEKKQDCEDVSSICYSDDTTGPA